MPISIYRKQSEAVFLSSSSQTSNSNVEANLYVSFSCNSSLLGDLPFHSISRIPDFCRGSPRTTLPHTQVPNNDEGLPNGPQPQAGPSQRSLTQTTPNYDIPETEPPYNNILLELLRSPKPFTGSNQGLSSLTGSRGEKI